MTAIGKVDDVLHYVVMLKPPTSAPAEGDAFMKGVEELFERLQAMEGRGLILDGGPRPGQPLIDVTLDAKRAQEAIKELKSDPAVFEVMPNIDRGV